MSCKKRPGCVASIVCRWNERHSTEKIIYENIKFGTLTESLRARWISRIARVSVARWTRDTCHTGEGIADGRAVLDFVGNTQRLHYAKLRAKALEEFGPHKGVLDPNCLCKRCLALLAIGVRICRTDAKH